jgi:hypothetical protein
MKLTPSIAAPELLRFTIILNVPSPPWQLSQLLAISVLFKWALWRLVPQSKFSATDM